MRTIAVAENRRYTCPCCGKNALDFTHKIGRHGVLTVLIYCHGCQAGQDAVHAASGISKERLLTWPPPEELGPMVSQSSGGLSGPPEELPAKEQLSEWKANLLRSRDPLNYLMRERGLTGMTIREHELGYGSFHNRPPAFMFPIRNGRGQLVNLKERYWPVPWIKRGDKKETWKRNLSNRPGHLYPLSALEKSSGGLIVCEGELDALLLNQALLDVPTVTSTTSTNWKPEWDRYVVGKRVAVLWDAGSMAFAQRRAEELVAAGAREAWAVDLTLAGLVAGEDMEHWFIRDCRSAEELRALIKQCQKGTSR